MEFKFTKHQKAIEKEIGGSKYEITFLYIHI